MHLTFIENLKLSGSKNMAVNGASAAQIFSYSPGNGVTVAVQELVCVLDDPGASSFNKFGSITALTNGLALKVTVNSITTTLILIKDNADLATTFTTGHFGSMATDTLGGAVGFGDSYDTFVGSMKLSVPIVLADSDSIQMVVQDNLTGISTLQVSCKYIKDI